MVVTPKLARMSADFIQALSPELCDVTSPESIYPKDGSRCQPSDVGQPCLTSKVDSGVNAKLSQQSSTDTAQMTPTSSGLLAMFKDQAITCSSSTWTRLSSCHTDPATPVHSSHQTDPATPVHFSEATHLSFSDTNTQISLCERSEDLKLEDPLSTIDESTFWSIVSGEDLTDTKCTVDSYGSCKAQKICMASDAPNSLCSPAVLGRQDMFDVGGAVSSAQFVFTKFGSELPNLFSFTTNASTSTSDVTSHRPVPAVMPCPVVETPALTLDKDLVNMAVCPSSAPLDYPSKRLKQPSLNLSFPSRSGNYELKILVQPEEQHRARYMTEGSRGAVKDRDGQGNPVVELVGYSQPITLQVHVGTDAGKVKPHGFYQACRVTGKNATQCTERHIDGTVVIETTLQPQNDMKAVIDCVGILKLRNADVEQRIGIARSKKKKVPTATLR